MPNLALAGGPWLYPKPDAAQAAELRGMNPSYFDGKLGETTRMDHCAFLSTVDGKNVIDRVRRIVAPPDVLAEACAIGKKYGLEEDRIVSSSNPEFAAPKS